MAGTQAAYLATRQDGANTQGRLHYSTMGMDLFPARAAMAAVASPAVRARLLPEDNLGMVASIRDVDVRGMPGITGITVTDHLHSHHGLRHDPHRHWVLIKGTSETAVTRAIRTFKRIIVIAALALMAQEGRPEPAALAIQMSNASPHCYGTIVNGVMVEALERPHYMVGDHARDIEDESEDGSQDDIPDWDSSDDRENALETETWLEEDDENIGPDEDTHPKPDMDTSPVVREVVYNMASLSFFR